MNGLKMLIFLGLIAALSGCQQEKSVMNNTGFSKVHFTHMADGEVLQLDKPVFTPLGEPVTITKFAYYIGNVSFVSSGGKTVSAGNQYFLIDEKLPESKTLNFSLPIGEYKGISMQIGVDSILNVSGVQSGALDPANGMFWSWNTGYIFAKLEGKSSVSTAPLQGVTYHIGGFKSTENAIQTIALTFPEILKVTSEGHSSVNLDADVDKWFAGPVNISIANEAFCMNPGSLALKIANNYSHMFSVASVINE